MFNKIKTKHKNYLKQKSLLKELQLQLSIIEAISKDTNDIFIIKPETETSTMLKINGQMLDFKTAIEQKPRSYLETWTNYAKQYVLEDEIDQVLEHIKLDNIKKELSEQDTYNYTYHCFVHNTIHTFNVKFSLVYIEGTGELIVAAISNIDKILEQKNKLYELQKEALTDKMTGFFNRTAFENIKSNPGEVCSKNNFVFITMDINELKIVNDNLGHEAGDELIKGAAFCIQKSMQAYGTLYRTGGDEFVALLNLNSQEIISVINEFKSLMQNWQGKIVSELSLSVGIAEKEKLPAATFLELEKLSDERMYNDKQIYYENKGIDREGQILAFEILKKIHTKILKINLAEDSFKIIQIRNDELNNNSGFSQSLSTWFKNLADEGFIFQEDREAYLQHTDLDFLRSYFLSGHTSFMFSFRRKIGNDFKRVLMDIVQTKEDSNDITKLFLYVKQIQQ